MSPRSGPEPDPPLRRAAEAGATFALVFLGTGACALEAATGRLGTLGVGLVFGAAVYASARVFGPLSGAHMNPAMTLALWRAGRFPGRELPGYLLAQATGALCATVLVRALAGPGGELGVTRPAIGLPASFALELLMTFALVLAVLRAPPSAGPALAGAIVAAEAVLAGPLTGASMNPVRSLTPALVSGRLDALWLYLLAPSLGAWLAAVRGGIRACQASPSCNYYNHDR